MILQEVNKALVGDLVVVQSGQRLALSLRQHPGAVPELLVHRQLRLVKHSGLYDGLLEPGEQLPVLLHLGGGGDQVAGADGVDWLVKSVREQVGEEPGLELGVVAPELKQFPLILFGDRSPGGELTVVQAELERFGEKVRSAVRGVVPADWQQSVERLLGDVRHLVIVLTTYTARPAITQSVTSHLTLLSHLSFRPLGRLSSLWGGDLVEGNLEEGLAEATGETSAKAISKISEAMMSRTTFTYQAPGQTKSGQGGKHF